MPLLSINVNNPDEQMDAYESFLDRIKALEDLKTSILIDLADNQYLTTINKAQLALLIK